MNRPDQPSSTVPTPQTRDDADESVLSSVVSRTVNEDKLCSFLVVHVMPFLYGGATRLPFIYFVIHLAVHFELNWLIIGLCVGAYQSCRVLVNILCIYAPKSAHLIGVSVGFAGYATVFFSDKDMPVPFIVGTAVIGLSETMACMQKYAKEMFKLDPDPKKAQRMLKYQYASVMVGVMFAFSLGGIAYQQIGINGVALFGMLLEGVGLLALVYYIVTRNNNRSPEKQGTDEASLKKPETPGKGSQDAMESMDLTTRTKRTANIGASSLLEDDSNSKDDSAYCSKVSSKVEEEPDGVIEFYPSDDDDNILEDEEEMEIEIKTSSEHSSPLFDEQILDTLEAIPVRKLSTDAVELEKQGDGVKGEVEEKQVRVNAADESLSQLDLETGEPVTVDRTLQEKGHSSRWEESIVFSDFDVDLASQEDEVSAQDLATLTDTGTMTVSMRLRYASSTFHTSEIPATWLNYLVCISFGIEALTIGYNLSIGPIFILNVFDVDTGITGFLFGIGAGFGATIAILVTCTQFGNRMLAKIVKSPYDLCFAMGGIAIGVFVASIQIFPVHVVGLLLLMAFNDLGATLLTEFQASITNVSSYNLLGPLGQVVRRSLNVVTAVTGPILYGFFPSLPYVVAGTVTMLWTVMLVVAFKYRSKRTTQNLADALGRSDHSVRSMMSFQTREVIRSVSRHSSISVESIFSGDDRSSGFSSGFSMAEDSYVEGSDAQGSLADSVEDVFMGEMGEDPVVEHSECEDMEFEC